MNKPANFLFNFTCLSVPLFIMAFIFKDSLLFFLLECLLLIILNFLLLKFATTQLQLFDISISNFENTDKNCMGIITQIVLSIIFPVLLPFASNQLNIDLTLIIVIAIVLCLFCFFAFGFTYNPILLLFGWHFYSLDLPEGGKYILLSKKKLLNIQEKITVSNITDYVLIAKE